MDDTVVAIPVNMLEIVWLRAVIDETKTKASKVTRKAYSKALPPASSLKKPPSMFKGFSP